MKFRKNNKKIVIVLGASALALGTVGFAGWVINEQLQIEKQSVSVSFGQVSDSSVVATLDERASDFKLSFDSLTDSVGKVTATQDKEDLTFKFVFSVTVGSSLSLTGVKFDINPDPFSTLVTSGYITKAYATTQIVTLDASTANGTYIPNEGFTSYTKTTPTGGEAQTHDVTYNEKNRKYNFVSTFNFKWGEKFNNTNPSKADDVEGGQYNADAIVANLNSFKTAYGNATGQTIGVTITPVTANK